MAATFQHRSTRRGATRRNGWFFQGWSHWRMPAWLALGLVLSPAPSWAERPALTAPVLTDDKAQPFYFTLPAPRGQILDRDGNPLARTKVVYRYTLRVPRLESETSQAFVAWVQNYWPEVAKACSRAAQPSLEALKQHFEHRRRIPMPISELLGENAATEAKALPAFVDLQTEYLRDYPCGTLAAHVIGYVTAVGPPLRGPLLYGEPLWREVTGRLGVEASMNNLLTGQTGLMMVSHGPDGRVLQRHVVKPPEPGRDVVTTLQSEMQAALEKCLGHTYRSGAAVVVDAGTGNILALASTPTFEPAAFASGLNSGAFAKIAEDPGKPLFNRAIAGQYPPGSLFKIVVALAGMHEGRLSASTILPCWPEVTIDGRLFRNWSMTDRGYFDLKTAIVRSCNTFFYQAAIAIGDQPILETARKFGFGTPPDLSLPGAAAGFVPDSVPTAQGQANLAIGQSPLLSTPLEVGVFMAALANGERRPRPRIVAQVQDQEGRVLFATPPAVDTDLDVDPQQLSYLQEAMYSTVNHKDGTGGNARINTLRVHGKTGTSQWSREGQMVTAAWFAGFVKECDPPLAFTVVLEGSKNERISGGGTAAPVIAEFLGRIAEKPQTFGVRLRKVAVPWEQHRLANINGASMPLTLPPPEIVKPVTGTLAAVPTGLTNMSNNSVVPKAIPVAESADVSSQQVPSPVTQTYDQSPRSIPTGEIRFSKPER